MARNLGPPAGDAYNVLAMKVAAALIYMLLASLAGCDGVSAVYTPTGGHLGAHISARNTWTASGDLFDAARAIDGDLLTVAASDHAYAGAELTIDLKQPCIFQTIILEHGRARNGFCRTVRASTSLDGKLFVDRYTGAGTRRVTHLLLAQPVLARYIRLRAEAPGDEPWSIAEVYLQ